MAKGTRDTGDFCWMNMLTPQPAADKTSAAISPAGPPPMTATCSSLAFWSDATAVAFSRGSSGDRSSA